MAKAIMTYLAVMGFCIAVWVGGCRPGSQEAYKPKPDDSMSPDVRVAAISFVPEKFNPEANVKELEKRFRAAAEQGAQIAVAPEGIIEGYVIEEVINGNAPLHRLVDVAITLDAPAIRHFQNLARELNMCLAFGFTQRKGDDIYNSAVFIDNKGKICGNYHKVDGLEFEHVPAERLEAEAKKYGRHYPSKWYNRPGEDNRAFDTPFGRGGFMICADGWSSSLARIQVLDGAQFLLVPSYGGCSDDFIDEMVERARENGVPVVQANVGVTQIVSKGEIVKIDSIDNCDEGPTADLMSVDTMAIPAAPSAVNRDAVRHGVLRYIRNIEADNQQ